MKKVRRLVDYDKDVWAALEFIYLDPLSNRMKRGAVSQLVNGLLRKQLKTVIEAQLQETKENGKIN